MHCYFRGWTQGAVPISDERETQTSDIQLQVSKSAPPSPGSCPSHPRTRRSIPLEQTADSSCQVSTFEPPSRYQWWSEFSVTPLLIVALLLAGKIPSCPSATKFMPQLKELCPLHKASSDPVSAPCTACS